MLSPTRIALRIAEQIVDTPVPQGRGGKRCVQGFLPELGSTAASSSLERISERTVEQTVYPSREERIPERIVEQTVFPSREGRIPERIVEQTVFPSREERIPERIVEQSVFPSREERISERTVEQIVDIPVHGRGVSSRGGFLRISGSSHGPDCSSDLLLPQLLYMVADVPVV